MTLYVVTRVEWFERSARAQRWDEEIEILVEEMNRVVRFFEYQEKYWEKQVSIREAEALGPGSVAYCFR